MAGILIVDQIQNSSNTLLINSGALAANTVGASQLQSGTALSNIGTGGMDQSYLNATSQYMGFKNRIINGAMAISQRGTSFNISSSGVYTTDRFITYASSGTATATQSTNAPAGFSNSLLWTQTSAGTRNASDYYEIGQYIEANNISDLGLGTASAKTFTLSFWVNSSITGVFSVAIRNNSSLWSQYVATYTITSANTWQYVTVTIPGPTSGTWATGTNAGLQIFWDLGSGSTYQTSTLNSWTYNISQNYLLASTQTAFGSVSGSPTFYLTGVQLEKGSTATSFDYRPYGTELALCQRYFVQIQKYTTFASASYFSSTRADGFMPLPVPMRTTPSFVVATGTNYYRVYLAGVSSNCSTVGFNGTNYQNSIALIYNNSDFSGLANGAGWWDSASSSSSIGVTAEL